MAIAILAGVAIVIMFIFGWNPFASFFDFMGNIIGFIGKAFVWLFIIGIIIFVVKIIISIIVGIFSIFFD
jgi:hypothetical protein